MRTSRPAPVFRARSKPTTQPKLSPATSRVVNELIDLDADPVQDYQLIRKVCDNEAEIDVALRTLIEARRLFGRSD